MRENCNECLANQCKKYDSNVTGGNLNLFFDFDLKIISNGNLMLIFL